MAVRKANKTPNKSKKAAVNSRSRATGRPRSQPVRKPTAKTSTAKISRASSTAKTRQTSTRATAPRAPISPEHRLDIIGIILMAAGVILLLTLLTFVQGAKSETPHLFLQWFGWGAYLLPLLLIVVGFWLLLSKIERFPAISTERVLGIMLLFSNLCVT